MRSSASLFGLVVLALTSACTRPPVDRALIHADKGFSCLTYKSEAFAGEVYCFQSEGDCEDYGSERPDEANACAPLPHAWCMSFTDYAGKQRSRCFGSEQNCQYQGINAAGSERATNISRCELF